MHFLNFSKALTSMTLLVSSALYDGLRSLPNPLPSEHLAGPEKSLIFQTSSFPLISALLSFYISKQFTLGFITSGFFCVLW